MRDSITTTNGQEETTLECTQKNELTRNQERFLLHYLTSPTMAGSAKATGVSHDTAQRWMQQPHIKARFTTMRQQHFDESLALLTVYTRSSITVLAKLMLDEAIPAGNRIMAAKILLEQSVAIHKIETLEQRIAELEAQE